ncbi:uncharacterized protein LOC135697134 [Ochlerotatus camptorhynchus]|uniref:uncharacterized protein LOC135697134 n=1 Tax=Ochlerotatus camptorhynchus TaxID=644619 RepID=UPI0031DD9F99
MDRETIKIANWSACSIKSKIIEFVDFLNKQNIDIAVITQTHLKPEVNIYFPGFRLLRLDRTCSGGGGVALAGGSAADLRRDIIKLTRRRENGIIAGDLNAKHQPWGNSRRNQNGTFLNDDLQEARYAILAPDCPTRLSRSGVHSTIDIFINNMGDNISLPVTHQELSSDHYPVVAEVYATVESNRNDNVEAEVNDNYSNYELDVEEVFESTLDYSPEEASDSQEDDTNDTLSLASFIQNWSLEYKIPHAALKPLINRLCIVDRTLPTDPRRLLGTPRKEPDLVKIEGGQYWHQGLDACLRRVFWDLNQSRCISININIDGLPLYKNGADQVWPILMNIFDLPEIKPMIIGIFHGKSKPKFVEEFLKPFVDEAEPILKSRISINNNLLSVKIRAFICDSPARAFIKGSVNFNSFHGCLKCTTVGERSNDLRVNVFPVSNAPKRTDEGYRNRSYGEHHQVYKVRENEKLKKIFVATPLLRLPIDMAEDIIVCNTNS